MAEVTSSRSPKARGVTPGSADTAKSAASRPSDKSCRVSSSAQLASIRRAVVRIVITSRAASPPPSLDSRSSCLIPIALLISHHITWQLVIWPAAVTSPSTCSVLLSSLIA